MQVIVYGPAIIAVIAILFVGLINFFSNKVGSAFSIITTIGKLVPIAAIIIISLFWGDNNAFSQTISEIHRTSGNFGVAVLSTLFGYDGWILIANLGGEMKNPKKVLPKAIIFGISAVLIIYTLITIATLRFIPANEILRLGENTTSYLATTAFGKIGGKLITIGIIISMLGTLNGKMITFPRIVYAMAKRHDLPFSRLLSYVTPKGKSPIVATLFIIVLATLMMLFFDPDRLSDLCIFTIYIFYLLAFFSIFILRRVNEAKRPFSVPLYPWVPIIAILGVLFVEISEIINDPQGILLFVGIVIIGLPILYLVKKYYGEKI